MDKNIIVSELFVKVVKDSYYKYNYIVLLDNNYVCNYFAENEEDAKNYFYDNKENIIKEYRGY
jgi:hypothetical protein